MGPKKHFTKEFVNEWSPRRELMKVNEYPSLPYRSESSYSSRESTSSDKERPITDPGTPRGRQYLVNPDKKSPKHHGRSPPLSKKPNLLLRGWQPEINERRKEGDDARHNRRTQQIEKPLLKQATNKIQNVIHDDVIFTESPSHPGTHIVYRLDAAKKSNPDKLYLDRRKLSNCPIIEGEDNVRLLNLQHNSINRIQRLSCLRRLIFLDLYDNDIDEIMGLSTLKSLRVLMLGKNRIKRIENLHELKRLDVLDLHGNKITRIENLSHLSELRVLNLAGNQLIQTNGLVGLTSLTELNLRRNKICKLCEIDSLLNLQRLFLSFNKISSFNDIKCLSGSTCLVELSMDENELCQLSNYRQNVLKLVSCLNQLDMIIVTTEERKIANVMAKKEEEKRKEANKRASLKEQRRAVIDNAHKMWISDHSHSQDSNFQREDSLKSTQADAIKERANIQAKEKHNILTRQDHFHRNPCHLAEIDGNVLSIYGDGALEAIERNWGERSVAMVTTAAFTYVSFDDLIPYFQKLKNRFVSVVNLVFTHTNISTFLQLNAFTFFRRLDNITINEDGNPITKLSLWKPYLLFRLSHLALKTINALEVTSDDKRHAKHLFEPLEQLTMPPTIDSENCSISKQRTKAVNQERSHPMYTPKDLLDNEAESQEMRATFSKHLMNEMMQLSYLTYKKQIVLEETWPTLLQDIIQNVADDLKSSDYGKKSLQKLLKEC